MGPTELLSEIRAQLQSHADPTFRKGLLWFFKEPVDPYGVRTPHVRRIAAAAYKELKFWPAARRNRLCNALWKSGKMEEGAVAIYIYRRFRKQCSFCEFHLFEKWIDRHVRNWAHCDGVSSWLLAACLENDPELIPAVYSWTESRNRWKRRAAAVSLLQEAKQGRHIEAILRVAGDLLGDPDEMVQKGVGWVLKEAYPKRRREVVRFLIERKAEAPRLVLRIAAEKMTEADRRRVLAKAPPISRA